MLNGIDNTISGPAMMFQVDPTLTSRAGFTPEEVQMNAAAMMQGEEAPTPVVIGGIAASMLLSLLVTPAVNYYITRTR